MEHFPCCVIRGAAMGLLTWRLEGTCPHVAPKVAARGAEDITAVPSRPGFGWLAGLTLVHSPLPPGWSATPAYHNHDLHFSLAPGSSGWCRGSWLGSCGEGGVLGLDGALSRPSANL